MRDRYDWKTLDLFSGFDHVVLSKQQRRTLAVLRDHQWWTIRELARACRQPMSSTSTVLRQLRYPKYGAFPIETRPAPTGHAYEYRLAAGYEDLTPPADPRDA